MLGALADGLLPRGEALLPPDPETRLGPEAAGRSSMQGVWGKCAAGSSCLVCAPLRKAAVGLQAFPLPNDTERSLFLSPEAAAYTSATFPWRLSTAQGQVPPPVPRASVAQ